MHQLLTSQDIYRMSILNNYWISFFVISRKSKIEVIISRVRVRLITLTKTLIILGITKTECNRLVMRITFYKEKKIVNSFLITQL